MSVTVRGIALATLVVCFSGCGPGSTPVPPSTTPPAESIKNDLGYILETGQVGSEMDTIQANINKIKEEDPAKAAALQKDYEQLSKARGPEARSIAKKMMGKL